AFPTSRNVLEQTQTHRGRRVFAGAERRACGNDQLLVSDFEWLCLSAERPFQPVTRKFFDSSAELLRDLLQLSARFRCGFELQPFSIRPLNNGESIARER